MRNTNRTQTTEMFTQNSAAAPSLCHCPNNNPAVTRHNNAHVVIPPHAPPLNLIGQCLELMNIHVLCELEIVTYRALPFQCLDEAVDARARGVILVGLSRASKSVHLSLVYSPLPPPLLKHISASFYGTKAWQPPARRTAGSVADMHVDTGAIM